MSKKKKLRFDTTKHDQKVGNTAADELAAMKKDVLSRIAKAYEQKRYVLTHKRKATTADVNRFLYDMQNLIHANASHPALAEWRDFTLQMLEEKIGQVVATEINKRNLFTPYRPTFAAPSADQAKLPAKLQDLPRACLFETYDEFKAIPTVERVGKQDGFFGLLLDGCMVMAGFEDGELIKLGAVANRVGLEKVPPLSVFQAAIKQREERN